MTSQADIEKDPFLVLLTDALRAGPGSPEWHDAVAKLKSSGESVDEYRLLIDAREALENGREYRSVRAGPGFTRKLLNNIDKESPAARRAFPIAGTVAVLAGLVIVAAIAFAIYQLYPRTPVAPQNKAAIDELASTYFPTEVLSTTFDKTIPPSWRKIGSLPIDVGGGLHAAESDKPAGGGLVAVEPIAADQPFSMQVTIQAATPSKDLIPQVFISNSSEFSPDRATSEHELVWQLQGNEQTVVIGGGVEKQYPLPPHTRNLTIRLVLNRDLAIVEVDGQRLWAGPHLLGDRPRFVGVRFIRTGGQSTGEISVQSVRVLKTSP
jgi:hypothetical protein